MSGFNGSGTFNISGVGLPYVSGTVISSTVANQLNTDLAAGLSNCILKDGTQAILANIPWNNYNINNLSAIGIGTSSPSYPIHVYNGTSDVFTVTSAGNTTIAGTATISGATTISGNITINSGTANGVAYLNGSKVLTTGSSFVFDGTNVGIGTSNPNAILNVVSSTVPLSILRNPTASSYTSLRLYNDQNSSARSLEIDYMGSTYSGGELASITTTGAYPLTFGTNNAERMRIDSSGNVGIGTSNILNKFQVHAATNINLGVNTGIIDVNAILLNSYTDSGVQAGMEYKGTQFIWQSSSAERMRIDSSGNVGIGFNSPTAQLQVGGYTGFSSLGDVTGMDYPRSYYGLNSLYNGTNFISYSDGSNNGGSIIYGDIFGNFKVATIPSTASSSPQTLSGTSIANNVKLRLENYGKLRIAASFSSGELNFQHDTANSFITGTVGLNIYNASNASGSGHVFQTNSSERMRIDSAGSVGINTSTPRAKTHIYGPTQLTSNLTDAGDRDCIIRLSGANSAAGSGGAVAFANIQGDNANSVGFAAIKGLLADGSSNTTGSIAFSTRRSPTDTSLTQAMIINTDGSVNLSASPSAGDNSTKVATTAFVQQTVGGSKLQTLTASAASGTITITLAPTTLDFRDPTATTGTISTVTSSSNLTFTSGLQGSYTLGAVSGTQARIAVLAINNSGTMELAIANLSGGLNLDETAKINTSALSGGTANNVVYSNTARSNVTYRVVGFIDATNTSGSWTLQAVQGAGGQALAALSSIGYGQTWIPCVIATVQQSGYNRLSNTVYYNTTGKPIQVNVCTGTTDNCIIYVGTTSSPTTVAHFSSGGTDSRASGAVIVPPNWSYKATGTIYYWQELR